jgi:CheY-like chemotaxis protein
MSFEATCPVSVLIVDDSEEVTFVLRKLLEKLGGIEVLKPAYDGVEALNQIRGSRPDILILDLKMPGLTGCDVLREIRYDGVRPTVIVFTGYSEADYGRPCKELGANSFIRKPDFDAVIRQVKDFLNHRNVPPQSASTLRTPAKQQEAYNISF